MCSNMVNKRWLKIQQNTLVNSNITHHVCWSKFMEKYSLCGHMHVYYVFATSIKSSS